MACKPLSKKEYLDLWRRVLPASYTSTIEEEGNSRGLDVPCLQARIWEDFAENLEVSQQAYFLFAHSAQTRPESQGAKKATGQVLVQRSAPVLGNITVPAGTKFGAYVTDSYGDEQLIGTFLSTEKAVLAEGDGALVPINVAAEFAGYAGNIDADRIDRFLPLGASSVPCIVTGVNSAQQVIDPTKKDDSFSALDIGRNIRLAGALASENGRYPRQIETFTSGSPQGITFTPALDSAADVGALVIIELEEFGDFGISVQQPEPITGGVSGALDAIGADRGVGRVPGEQDEQYRDRIGQLADTISPSAIRRALGCTLGECGIRFTISETRDVQGLMGFTWDLHPYDFGQISPIGKPAGSQYVGQGGVYMGEGTITRFFVISVSCPEFSAFGLAYNDGPFPNAYDERQPYDGQLAQSLDGYNSCIARAYAEVDKARAAGVGFIIVQDCEL